MGIESLGVYENIRNKKTGECLLATVVEGTHIGEKALFCNGRLQWESVAETEEFLKKHTAELLAEKGCRLLELEGGRVFCEQTGSEPVMVICGGGHVSIPIIEIAKKTGFHVTVLEDRPMFADNARRAGADEVLCDTFENSMKKISGNEDTYFVIVTRGHRYDTDCLRAALGKKNAYVGMMGSRKRVGIVKQQLEEEGLEKELLERVYTPIGLAIGAETPEEIAVSVMAEIIQVKNQKKKSAGYDRKMLAYLTGEEPEMKKVLATIISRKGSAPRSVGTKMLVLEDGRTIGTIGGGCAESEIIHKCLFMMQEHPCENQCPNQLCKVDMTGQEAEDAGMVCGGTIEVYLERIV